MKLARFALSIYALHKLFRRLGLFTRVVMASVCLLCLSHATAYGQADDDSSTRLLLSASELDYPPFAVVREGNLADGFSVDILKAVIQVVGRQVRISVGPWSSIKQQLIDGQLDVLPLVAYSEEREKFFDFSNPYLQMQGSVFVRQHDNHIKELRDLRDKELIVMRGDSAHEYVLREKLSRQPILTETVAEAMQLLANGHHDAVVVQKLVGLQIIKQLGITNLKSIPGLDHDEQSLRPFGRFPEFLGQKFCLAVKKGDAELLRDLNEGLAIIMSNGTYNALYDKWFGPILPRPFFTPRLARAILLGVGPLLLLFAGLGVWYLRREVARKTVHLQQEISKRVIAEEALSDSVKSLNMAQRVAQIGSWDWEIPANSLRWSAETFRHFDLQPDEFEPSYQLFEQFMHPDDRDMVNQAVQRALQEDQPYSIEARMFRRGGEEWLMHAQGIVYRDEQGKAIRFIGIQQDITEQKKAEEGLRLQGEIIANMSEGVYLVRAADGIIVFTNEKFERMFGYDPGEMLGQHVTIVNAPTDKDPREIANEIIAALQATGAWQGEVANIRKDGTPFWCQASVSTFEHWRFGKVFVSIHSDITERKVAELALRQSEEKNRRILSRSIDGFFVSDLQGRFVEANDSYCRMVGYPIDELKKMVIMDVEANESPAETAEHIKQVMLSGHERFETKHYHKDGHVVELEMSANFDNSLNELFFVFVRDITDRKLAQANLKASEERYRLLTENSVEAIWQFSLAGTIDFINAAGAKMLGYEQDEMKEMHFSVLLSQEWLARGEEVVARVLGGQVVQDEIFVKHKHGHDFPVSFTLAPIQKEGRILGASGIARDITEKRREEEEELRKSLAEKESLLKEIHHRVKNNMQIVSSLLFLQGQNTDNPEVHSVIQDSRNRVRTMGLIHEKLYQTKNLARVDFDDYLKTLTSYLVETFSRPACKLEISVLVEDIYLSVDTAIPCGLIINELVTNSMKYGSLVSCPCKIKVSMTRLADGRLLLSVADNGPGLPAGFNPQASGTLGLNLVSSLAKQLGASLEFRNDNGLVCDLTFAATPQIEQE